MSPIFIKSSFYAQSELVKNPETRIRFCLLDQPSCSRRGIEPQPCTVDHPAPNFVRFFQLYERIYQELAFVISLISKGSAGAIDQDSCIGIGEFFH